ncbi:unnamed protein product, partial [Meganyctiphanes norvegica]|uniref:HTH CENPB-type domain-containing protein n=1 Tax=Meganyctiphanes norvegica TaxID=48144 RepID=A0AAV2PXH2_MEGNR
MEELKAHNSLTIEKKREIILKVESGTLVLNLCEDQVNNVYNNSDSKAVMSKRKTLHESRNNQLDKVLYEWLKVRRSEGVPMTHDMIKAQAKEFNQDLNLNLLNNTDSQEFSNGWFYRFVQCHGVKYISATGERLSSDTRAVEDFIIEFELMKSEEDLSEEQIFNADEFGVMWKYIQRSTYVIAYEHSPGGFKDNMERLTIMGCSNMAGTCKMRPMVIGKAHKT